MEDPILRAKVYMLLSEVILSAKIAWRCKESCKKLKSTLNFVLQHVEEWLSFGIERQQLWLGALKDLLEEVKEIIENHCVVQHQITGTFGFSSLRQSELSLKILNIDNQIKLIVQEMSTATHYLDETFLVMKPRMAAKEKAVVDYNPQVLPPIIVGLENNPFQKLKSLIMKGSGGGEEPMLLVLKGLRGIGKTLVAQMLQNDMDIGTKFGVDSIFWITLGKDAEISLVYSTMGKFLREKVFDCKHFCGNKEEQRTHLIQAFKCRKVFLILDDIWEQHMEWLDVAKGQGSVTLVTTRIGDVLANGKTKGIISMPLLSGNESWKLFCYHAFGCEVPPSLEIGEIAKVVCNGCCGHPLALMLMGGAMYGKWQPSEWKNASSFMRPGDCVPEDVENNLFEPLEFCYNELDDEERKLFLYFAAFPENYKVPIGVLCSIWHVEQKSVIYEKEVFEIRHEGLMKLISLADRSFISFSENGENATMCDILRDLAIHITRKADRSEWSSKFNSYYGEDLRILPSTFVRVKSPSLLGSTIHKGQDNLQVLSLSRLHGEENNEIKNTIDFRDSIFLNNPNLLFVDFSKTNIEELPHGIESLQALIYLDLSMCTSLRALPQGITRLRALSSLNLSGCESLEKLPHGIGRLRALTYLDLSMCTSLRVLPEDIDELEALLSLNLSGCESLEKLPHGIGWLRSLTYLDLSMCTSLRVLPEDIYRLRALSSLNLSGCESLEKLPNDIVWLQALTYLDLSMCTSLRLLPEDIIRLEALLSLNLSGCESLEKLPHDIGWLRSLTYLDLSMCTSLRVLPKDIYRLRALLSLNLSGCESFEKLPHGIGRLRALTYLDLSMCTSLRVLPEDIDRLEALLSLNLSGCESLEELPNDIVWLQALTYLDLSMCTSLRLLPEDIIGLEALLSLNLSGCESLEKLPHDIGWLRALTYLDLSMCTSLRVLPHDISGLRALSSLNLSGCESLEELPNDIVWLRALTYLDLSMCTSLRVLPRDINRLRALSSLNLSGCTSLKELPKCINGLNALTSLNLSGCTSLKELAVCINGLNALTSLDLSECTSLKSLLQCINGLNALISLDLSGCTSLQELPEGIKEMRSLTSLNLKDCSSLEKLSMGIKELKALTFLNLLNCTTLKELPESINGLNALISLDLSGCTSLNKLSKGITELKTLTSLDLIDCESLEELPEDIHEMKSLTSLNLTGCENMKKLPKGIKELKALTFLNLTGCKSLKRIPEDIKELTSLTSLYLWGCKSLEELPESIGELSALTILDLRWCTSLKKLPEGMKELSTLKNLDLWGCVSLKEIPEGIKELKAFKDSGLISPKEFLEYIKALTSSSKEGHFLVKGPLHDMKEIASDSLWDGRDMLGKDAIPFQPQTSSPFSIGKIILSLLWASLKHLFNIGLGGIGFTSMKLYDFNAKSSGGQKSFELQSRDLPSTSLLGKGLAGIGYETTWKGARYARKDFFGVPKDIFLKEAPLLVSLEDHKNIVKTYGWTTDKRSCSLVLEYMDDDLVSLLQKRMNSNKVLGEQSSTSTPTPPFDLPEALYMMLQIATGVAYLHAKGLVHGDLKTKNILVSRMKGGDLNSKVVKVTDYSLVQTKRKSEFIVSRQVRKLDMVRWKAPECWGTQLMRQLNTFNNEVETSSESESESTPSSASEVSFTPSVTSAVDTSAADVYSFAMICSQLLTGTIPYPHKNWKELGCKILDGLRPDMRDTCHPKLRDLLMSCWGAPAKRPTFDIVCSKLTLVQQSLSTAMVKQPQEVAMPFNVATPLADKGEMGASTEESTTSSSSRLPSTSATSPTSDAAVAAITWPGPTSSRERIRQVSTALNIIENVQKISENVWVNKNQCQRVADRFRAIGHMLRMYITPADVHSTLYYPAFDELLRVLQKGQALVSNYFDQAAIKGLLTWGDNREAFKEIHEELESMKVTFPFDIFGDQFEIASWSERARILTHDADQDVKPMKAMKYLPQSCPATELTELEQVVRVALERSGPLPSCLQIDVAKVRIKDPVKVQKLRSPVAKLDGAVVCEGSWLGCDVAVMVFKSEFFEWNKGQMLKEVGTLMELQHPHIVRFIGFAQGPEICAVLMELMPEKDLRHYMENHAPFTRSEQLDIITQIAKGMLYLHTQGYVHGDLKCSNILVKKHKDYIEVKIGDLRYGQKLESAGGSSEFVTLRRPRWSPPEALEKYGGVKPTDELLRQADVYSFAMTCYEIVTEKWPFDGIRTGLNAMIKAGERPQLPADLHSALKGLIESCWASDPNERPVFENICLVLELIRSSMPGVTNKIANFWNAFKQIPPFGVSHKYPPTTTWNETTVRQSEREPGADGVIKLPECLNIKHEDLKKVRRVGKGASATVYEAKWLGSTIAVKRIEKLVNNASVRELQQELDFLIQLRHPFIIQLVGFSVDKKGRCLIVMEFMKGSLRELIDSRVQKSSKPFDEKEELGIITKLAQGMLYLHCKGVTHRGLKATNVLCQDRGGSIDVKIVDFGVSQFIANAGQVASMAGVGTFYWRAPEILPTTANRSRQGGVDLMAVDVYSFAMTCYEIVTGLQPFELEFGPVFTRYDEVMNGVRPELPPTLNAGLRDLITDCWQTDPAQRPDFAEICTRLSEIGQHL